MSRLSTRPWIFSLLVIASLTSCQAPTPEKPASPPVVIKGTELDNAYEELDRAIRENAEEDQIRLIAGLTEAWEKTNDSQKKRFRGQLAQGLKHDNVEVKRAVFRSLGYLRGGTNNREAKASTKTLVQVLSLMRHYMDEKDNDLVIVGLESLGKLRHVSGLTMLFDHLTHTETAVVVAAIAALADYERDTVEHRKIIFRKIIDSVPGDQAGGVDPRVEAAIDKTLARITRRSFKGRVEWSRWWNSEGETLAEW